MAPAWGADVEVVIAGLTNTYSSYITTWEEYQARFALITGTITPDLVMLRTLLHGGGKGMSRFAAITPSRCIPVSRCSGTRAHPRCTGRTRWEPTSRSSAGVRACPVHRHGSPANAKLLGSCSNIFHLAELYPLSWRQSNALPSSPRLCHGVH